MRATDLYERAHDERLKLGWVDPFPNGADASGINVAASRFGDVGANDPHDDAAVAWLKRQAGSSRCAVTQIPLADLHGWRVDGEPARLRHVSGRFFTVGAVEVYDTFGTPRRWVQPILEQYEIGILGMLARRGGQGLELLVQAKAEPGDVSGAQAAPTVQATRSNYERVHRGSSPALIERLLRPAPGAVIVDQLQPEHGGFFLRKLNRNRVVLIEDDVVSGPSFRWMTLSEIASLSTRPESVNMSLRTVLSALACAGTARRQCTVPDWFCRYARKGRLELRRREFVADPGPDLPQPFDVIGVAVRADREVACWSQPIIRARSDEVDLFFCSDSGELSFLVCAAIAPGHRRWAALGPSWCGYASDAGDPVRAAFGRRLAGLAGREHFSVILSEEGGRFAGFRNRYRIIEIERRSVGALPPGYGWLDLAGLKALTGLGLATIELRSLLAIWWLRREGGRLDGLQQA
jgi:dTDP-4-dehydro-6-deoxy-alpha-D-glucopyranose 2,3-dehydratase